MKKLIQITMIALLIFGSVKLTAGTYSGGGGINGNPYKIATVADLIELSNTPADWSNTFIQTADIVFNSDHTLQDWDGDGNPGPAEGFLPIGNNSHQFGSRYNGQNHTISNLYINRPTTDYVALFGKVNSAGNGAMENIHLINATVIGHDYVGGLIGFNPYYVYCCSSTGSITGANNVGGLIGWDYNATTRYCSSAANVTGTGTGTGSLEGNVGGLIGLYGDLNVWDCYATGNVTGFKDVGGFAGRLTVCCGNETLRCYSTGNASGTVGVGGFAGEAHADNTSIQFCYSTGNASGTDKVGGFVGYHNTFSYSNRIDNCYSLGNVTRSSGTNTSFGGFCGTMRDGHILSCYSIGKVYQSPGIIWTSGGANQGFIGKLVLDEGYILTLVGNLYDMNASQQTYGGGHMQRQLLK